MDWAGPLLYYWRLEAGASAIINQSISWLGQNYVAFFEGSDNGGKISQFGRIIDASDYPDRVPFFEGSDDGSDNGSGTSSGL